MSEGPVAPYRTAFAACVGTALLAGLVTALLDVGLTLAGASHVGGGDAGSFALVAVCLYLPVALLLGLGEGLVAGAVRATHPGGSIGRVWRRLRDDEPTDRAAAAALVAAAVAGLVYALVVAGLSMRLVAGVERKGVGALLLGFVAVGAVVPCALLAYPAFRVARRAVGVVPRLGRLPVTALLALVALGGGALLAVLVMVTRLDWQALKLGAPMMFAAFVAVQLGSLTLAYGPLAGLRARLPARGVTVAAAAALAAIVPLLVVPGRAPSERTLALLSVESRGAGTLVKVARGLSDRDKDGYAALLGGGDCDDRRADVHPGAKDVPGNGVDENCNGADAPARGKDPGNGAGAGPGQPPEPAALSWKGNVVVIAVDTLRADRLGAAGYARGGKSLTPRMDELVARGVWFTHAWAQAPHTPRSFPSIFTSNYPSSIAWNKSFSNYPRLLDENQTLWESLAAAGVHTVGESSHFYFTDEFGITQGFTEYDNADAKNLKDSNSDIASPRIVPRVKDKLAELGASKRRFAMFVHLFEPHSTYVVHEGVTYEGTGQALFEEKYDREVEFVDRYVGEVVDAIAAAGLADDTLIVLLADHGEAFFVHSYQGQKLGWHGQTLYDEVMRVPLVIVGKGLTPGRVDTPVMLLDVAPTLLELMGVPVPGSFQGRSLAPALAGKPLPPRPAYAELLPYPNFNVSLKMMVTADGGKKIVKNLTDRVIEVYDLAADPEERKNLAYDQPDLAKALEKDLEAWVDSEL
jgi:arylsulfatase A-like enzyme